jgi:heme exporter protein B
MIALFTRELRLNARSGGAGFTTCVFFLALIITLPFALGPDLPLLTRLAPGLIWIGAFLAALLASESLFKADLQDGSLDLFILSPHSLTLIVAVKASALFITTGVPLIITLPVMSLLLNLEFESLPSVLLSLTIGLPALALLSTLGAAIAISLKKGGVLAAILILPLAFPVLIFGVSSANGDTPATLLLTALLFIYTATLPFFSALALREAVG